MSEAKLRLHEGQWPTVDPGANVWDVWLDCSLANGVFRRGPGCVALGTVTGFGMDI